MANSEITFPTEKFILAITDSDGIAMATPFTPNSYRRPFVMTVTVSGYANLSAVIPLRN